MAPIKKDKALPGGGAGSKNQASIMSFFLKSDAASSAGTSGPAKPAATPALIKEEKEQQEKEKKQPDVAQAPPPATAAAAEPSVAEKEPTSPQKKDGGKKEVVDKKEEAAASSISSSQAKERRSKKGEDKAAPPSTKAGAASSPPPPLSKASSSSSSSSKKEAEAAAAVAPARARKRIRKTDDEDAESDDDLLGDSSKKKAEEKDGACKKSKTDAPAAGVKKSTTATTKAEKTTHAAVEVKAQAMEVAVEKKVSSSKSDGEEEHKANKIEGDEEEDEEEEEEEGSSSNVRSISSVLKSSSSSVLKKKGKTSSTKVKPKAATTTAILAEIGKLSPGYPSLPYRTLTNVLEAIESVSGRLEITDIVRELLMKTIECCPQDLSVLMYLLCGKIAPAYEGTELGIGDSSLLQAIASAIGCSAKQLDQKGEGTDGDLATAAQRLKTSQRTLGFGATPKALTSKDVLEEFRNIAKCSGGKSMTQKTTIIRKLLLRCSKEGSEIKFLVRGLQCKLRCNLAEPTVLTALAQAFVLAPPTFDQDKEVGDDDAMEFETEGEGEVFPAIRLLLNPKTGKADRQEAAEIVVKQAYSECPNYDKLIENLLKAPLTKLLQTCRLQPGVPVKPMLAKAQISFQEVLKRMAGLHFTMEYKYDGERAQIHKMPDGTIKIFSRNSEDTTGKYPDLVAALPQAIKEGTTSFVIDAEAVAFDPQTKKLLPFQILSTRKRKAEKVEDIKVQVVIYTFDVLFLNDRPVLQEPLIKRRALLRDAFTPVEGKFEFAISMDHQEDGDTLPIEGFLDEAVTGNCEGLMIKTLEENATYEPTKRSLNWLKLKKDYLSSEKGKGPADSLDLVVIGANYGQGKRTGWYGAFLLACYDPESEEYQSVCKIGTGFSEEMLAKVKPELDALIIPSKPSYYKTALDCDVWFEAKTVWEVRAADLSKSSVHKGALNKLENGKGIALRFPRFIRERADKNPEDATNAEQLVDAYKSQALAEKSSKSSGGKGGGDDDDDDGYI